MEGDETDAKQWHLDIKNWLSKCDAAELSFLNQRADETTRKSMALSVFDLLRGYGALAVI